MSIHRASLGLALAGLLAASVSAATDSGAAVATAGAPAGTATRFERALRRAVTRHVAEAGLEASLRGFTLSPSLLQLRSYVDPGEERTKFVCVVGLALKGEQGELLAEIRGSAATADTSELQAIDAAAHAAVVRLPGALAELEASRAKTRRVARR